MAVVLSEPCGACPPCNGHCHQGRMCPANQPAEACTDLGADADRDDGMGTFRGLLWALPLSAAIVGAGVLVVWFWPVVR